MGWIGDDDDGAEVVFAGDLREALDLLLGVDGGGLGDDVVVRDAIRKKVVATDSAFGVAGSPCRGRRPG